MTREQLYHKLPSEAGVYLMKSASEEVLYVGKAKNIKQRVRQYFTNSGDSRPMIPHLIQDIATIDYIIVRSEKEALLLENNLIKHHQPKYNVLLKDDKSYVSLCLDKKNPWPRLTMVRSQHFKGRHNKFFGPYTSAHAARQTLELLRRIFPLRRCSDQELQRRKKPCLLYQMKRCLAPCTSQCTSEEYHDLVERVDQFLSGKNQDIIDELYHSMHQASQALEFERAAELLEAIHNLEKTVEIQNVHNFSQSDLDVIGLYRQADEVAISRLIYHDGKLLNTINYTFNGAIQNDDELITSFLMQTYENQAPPLILIPNKNDDLPQLMQFLKTKIHHPQRGSKLNLLAIADKNAQTFFVHHQDKQKVIERQLLELKDSLSLTNYPKNIECFDTSNLSGAIPVAAMVAFIEGQKQPKFYRKYNIPPLAGQSDYTAMEEVLERRLKRCIENSSLPDLIIVDGGRGQLGVATKILKKFNIATVDLIALTKEAGRHDRGLSQEKIFVPNIPEAIILDRHSPTLFMLQRIRDEAHRFAVTFQRNQRSRKTIKTALTDIPGIGPTKAKRLLKHFGSIKRVKAASQAELLKISGINAKDAQQILIFCKKAEE
ncbi:MAG: excinuclease ABC subunit UvrC [Chlamydiota bacterium]